ncbi:hypothetical protein [Bacillus sp. P14.5]|uniref:hypothetical protein n=1 Tax=Bacillus sp. P14.5 TaxID=1983400 RepID=UPI0013B05DE1|nr:hypothetical protein [Bacillus sp. P14.5]
MSRKGLQLARIRTHWDTSEQLPIGVEPADSAFVSSSCSARGYAPTGTDLAPRIK